MEKINTRKSALRTIVLCAGAVWCGAWAVYFTIADNLPADLMGYNYLFPVTLFGILLILFVSLAFCNPTRDRQSPHKRGSP